MAYSSYNVRLLRSAEEDLTDLVSFALADSAPRAKALMSAVVTELEALTDRPRLGPTPEDSGLAQAGFRYLIIDDLLIFYTIEEDVVYVHRIIHGATDYKGLFGRWLG